MLYLYSLRQLEHTRKKSRKKASVQGYIQMFVSIETDTAMMTTAGAGNRKGTHRGYRFGCRQTFYPLSITKIMESKEQKTPETVETVPTEKKDMVPVGQMFPRFPTQAEWNTINTIAVTLKNGGVLPKGIDTVQKMVVVLQAGREIGLQPIEALNSLYFVNGKVSMYGEAVPMQIMRAGHKITWGKCDKHEATVTITRGDDGQEMTQTFTMEEAKERGYTSNPIYQKYPENMLKWRVLGMVAKFIAPDALRGIGIKEDMEVEAVDEGGTFHSKSEEKRIKTQMADGSYNERKPLDVALDETDSEPDVQVDAPAGFPCVHCKKVMKTKAGLTKHLKTHVEETGKEE